MSCLAVDDASQYVVSGSGDASIFIWSLLDLLASDAGRQKDPQRRLKRHRDAVTDVRIGRGTSAYNIAVSVSKDLTAIVWDYHRGNMLRMYLLSAVPQTLALDPASRAAYIGYVDGSLHLLDFYRSLSAIQEQDAAPMQALEGDRWTAPGLTSAVCSLATSFDGTTLISGHADGQVHAWAVTRGKYKHQVAMFGDAVTNLVIPLPTGFQTASAGVLTKQVIRPRYGDDMTADPETGAPRNMNLHLQLASPLRVKDDQAEFGNILEDPLFPSSFLDEYLAELEDETQVPTNDGVAEKAQTKQLAADLEAALAKISEYERQRKRQTQMANLKAAKKQRRRVQLLQDEHVERTKVMEKTPQTEFDMEDLSSDTDELTD